MAFLLLPRAGSRKDTGTGESRVGGLGFEQLIREGMVLGNREGGVQQAAGAGVHRPLQMLQGREATILLSKPFLVPPIAKATSGSGLIKH